jgi:hypothetical protein
MDDNTAPAGGISKLERVWLSLVFGGPIAWWLAMARVMRVPVAAEERAGEACFRHAEAGAARAARWFPYGLTATGVAVVAFFWWSPIQARLLEPIMHVSFHAVAEDVLANGGPYTLAIVAASATMLSMGLIVGLLNASLFGAAPLLVLRLSTAAAAPAVSVALARKTGAVEADDYAQYPRLALAVETVLGPRRPRRVGA